MKKKILVASDSFKGSLSAQTIADLVEEVVLEENLDFEVIKMPVSDGGEGFLDSLKQDTFEVLMIETIDLDHQPIKVPVLKSGTTCYVETAKVCGLNLNNRTLDPWNASTFGLGLLVKKIMSENCQRIVMGVGGTGTNDAGTGFLMAFDFKFKNNRNEELKPGLASMKDLDKIEVGDTPTVEILIATDVTNPLLGPRGATYVFGPQKGLTLNELDVVEDIIGHVSSILSNGVEHLSGSGAAGGLPYSLISFFSASIVSGIDWVLDNNQFSNRVKESSLVITGEGFADQQSLDGKAISRVIKRSQEAEVPVVCICGDYTKDVDGFGVPMYRLREPGMSAEDSMRLAHDLYKSKVRKVLRDLSL